MVLRASREGKTWYDMALVLCTVVWCASLSRLDELLDDLQAAKGGKIMRKDLNCLKRTKKLSRAQMMKLQTLAVLI